MNRRPSKALRPSGRLKWKEYRWIHTYADLAGLSRSEYEALLQSQCGVISSTELDHESFEVAMAAVEAILWQRVEAGHVPDPRRQKAFAHLAPMYWRLKVPAQGMINSRQRYKIEKYWTLLADYLQPEERTDAYLAGIIARTTGLHTADLIGPDGWMLWDVIPASAARLSIEAIKDRLKFAVRQRKECAA